MIRNKKFALSQISSIECIDLLCTSVHILIVSQIGTIG